MLTQVATETSRFTASEQSILFLPKHTRHTGLPGVIYCHTTGVTSAGFNHPAFGQWQICEKIASWGFAVAAADLGVNGAAAPADGKNTWGNSVARARIEDVRAGMIAQGICKNAPVYMVGASMGCLNMLNYAIANPTRIRGLVAVLGVVNLTATYSSNRGTAGSLIAGAWGITYPAALAASADPNAGTNKNPIIDKPFLSFYAPDDTAVFASESIAFEAAMGRNAQLVSVGNLGHTETAISAAANHSALMNFFATLMNL